jgi:hypothetical protein
MGQRDFSAIIVCAIVASGLLPGCFTTQLVRTDTVVTYDVIRAPIAPPAVPAGAVVAAPSPAPSGMTWMAPYWTYSGGQYSWIQGRWVPTLAGYGFLQPYWRATRGGWALVLGGWTDAMGRIVATPPPDLSSSRTGYETCETSPPDSPGAAWREPGGGDDHPHARVDHTVTLGHHYYTTRAHADAEADGASSGASASASHASSTGTTSATTTMGAPRYVSRTYSAPSSYASSSSSSSSSAPSRTGYSSSSSSTSSRTGYSSSSSSSSSSSGGGGSWGSRTGYSGGSTSIGSTTSAP